MYVKRIKFNKKAAGNQVDWAISLSIFLLMITWFFLMIRPLASSEIRSEQELNELLEVFENEIKYTVDEISIFAKFNKSQDNVPLMIKKPNNWNDYSLGQGIFFEELDDHFIFITDVKSGGNKFKVVQSGDTYLETSEFSKIQYNNNELRIDEQNYIVNYNGSVPDEVFFENNHQVQKISYYINDVPVQYYLPNNLTKKDLVMKNSNSHAVFDMENYAFTENPFIFFRILPQQYLVENYEFKIVFDLDPSYTLYETKNTNLIGNKTISLSSCQTFNDYGVDFRNSLQGITFSSNSNMTFEACPNGGMVELSMSTMLNETLEFGFNSHKGQTNNYTTDYLIQDKIILGTQKEIEGYSRNKIITLDGFTGKGLRNKWNYTSDRNFEIELFDEDQKRLFFASTGEYGNANVFVKQERNYLVNRYGEQKIIFTNIRMW